MFPDSLGFVGRHKDSFQYSVVSPVTDYMLVQRTLSSSVSSCCLKGRFSWTNLLTFSLSPKIYTCLEMYKLFNRHVNHYNPSEILNLLDKQEIAKDKGLQAMLAPCGISRAQEHPGNCFLFHAKSFLFDCFKKERKKKMPEGRTNKANEAKSRWQKAVALKVFLLIS